MNNLFIIGLYMDIYLTHRDPLGLQKNYVNVSVLQGRCAFSIFINKIIIKTNDFIWFTPYPSEISNVTSYLQFGWIDFNLSVAANSTKNPDVTTRQ